MKIPVASGFLLLQGSNEQCYMSSCYTHTEVSLENIPTTRKARLLDMHIFKFPK